MADDEPQLPEELAALLSQLGGSGALEHMQQLLSSGSGPVNWRLASQVALRLAAPDDRAPEAEETERAEEAQQLAEHWLDEGSLPAPPDAGRLAVVGRQTWVNDALTGLRPLVEPVARASIDALNELMRGQAETLPTQVGIDLSQLGDLGAMLGPVGGFLMGMQTGQVVGQLSRQMLGQYDLGVPTAQRQVAYRVPVNVAETFDGYELDRTEVEVVLALHEGAARRQYHAVAWLGDHLARLVESFAQGLHIDADELLDVSRGLMLDMDPEDPDSLEAAMRKAGQFRLQPTVEQQRVLERIQGVVCLLQAWARLEVRSAAQGRLPNVERIEEVLRRRRASKGDGEKLLAALLGLDLRPDDEEVGDHFVTAVRDARGLDGLRRALAHPENLPDTEELAEPSRWLVRMAGGEEVPDDASALFEGLGDAPIEPPGEERGQERGEERDEDPDDGGVDEEPDAS